MLIKRKIVIEVWGDSESDVEEAFDEAVDRLRNGCIAGADRAECESGGFTFSNDEIKD